MQNETLFQYPTCTVSFVSFYPRAAFHFVRENTRPTCLEIAQTEVIKKPLQYPYKFGTERVYTATKKTTKLVVFLVDLIYLSSRNGQRMVMQTESSDASLVWGWLLFHST